MYLRMNYEMTQEDLDAILDACRPVPVMFISGGYRIGGDQQSNAYAAWARLGLKMGFDPMTVRPISGGSDRMFSAVPSETESQRAERLVRETEEKRVHELADVDRQIAELQLKRLELSNKENSKDGNP